MEEYTSLNIPSRCSNTIEKSFMEFQEIGMSAIDPSSAWQFDFDFEQSKLQINYVHPKNVSTEFQQNTTDEILVGESLPGSIMEPTSDLHLGTVSWNIDYNSENSSDRLGILSLSQFDLFPSKQKTALQKETWLDDISAKESETKCENLEQRNKEIENIAMLGFTSRITAPTKFPRIEDSFIETQAIVYSALDSIVQFQTDFHAEQSNLPFHFIDPKSVSTELLQESTDEKLFGESALRWNIGTASDITFGTDSRNINYISESSSDEFGSLSFSQTILGAEGGSPELRLALHFGRLTGATCTGRVPKPYKRCN
ncbi:hypothetical protein TNCT_623981 [Trichonephila clavata]|uniref:Uncharacterized protein n=1 Tax=Trichonephila clavata TaxID=2740835 RepID=A0A8X6GQU8_TRICU|nr:hypothetical protein TNCT_623981 [Trichonephila clavata]